MSKSYFHSKIVLFDIWNTLCIMWLAIKNKIKKKKKKKKKKLAHKVQVLKWKWILELARTWISTRISR